MPRAHHANTKNCVRMVCARHAICEPLWWQTDSFDIYMPLVPMTSTAASTTIWYPLLLRIFEL
eukprot:10161343-Lingulodinium_polyedra.AAC.1